jgi:hypothetical protein
MLAKDRKELEKRGKLDRPTPGLRISGDGSDDEERGDAKGDGKKRKKEKESKKALHTLNPKP